MAKQVRIPALLLPLPARERRREKRTRIRASEGRKLDFLVVTEVSPRGARLITAAPVALGDEVELKLPLLEPVKARIVWVSRRIAGCQFAEPLHPAWLRVLAAAAAASGESWALGFSRASILPPDI